VGANIAKCSKNHRIFHLFFVKIAEVLDNELFFYVKLNNLIVN